MDKSIKDALNSPEVRNKILEKLDMGVSPDAIASTLNVPISFITSISRPTVETLKENTRLLISYVPDSIKVLVDMLNSYWTTDNINTKKLAISSALKVLESTGILSSEPQSYHITNYIQNNNISNDFKVIISTFKDNMDRIGKMVNEMYKLPNTLNNGYRDDS